MESQARTGARGGVADDSACANPTPPELKVMVLEATRALARLDVDRLHELALSCHVLINRSPELTRQESEERVRQARAASGDLALFGRVLEATRANAKVMERLRELRTGKATYTRHVKEFGSWSQSDAEGHVGNN